MQIRKHIPNLLTLGNLLSGSIAIVLGTFLGQPELSPWLIILAAVFDFFDGLVARALGVSSPIGKDLDSLADIVSFGLAPAVLVWQVVLGESGALYWSFGVFVLVAFAALRLAKFNNDPRQSHSFRGIPVPANALFWLGMLEILPGLGHALGSVGFLVLSLGLSLGMGLLMVSDLPMFSFKLGGRITLASHYRQLVLLVVSVLGILLLGWGGCAILILAYILLSLLPAKESAPAGK